MMSSETNILSLPEDTLRLIYGYLSPNDIGRVVCTCKKATLSKVAKENIFWANKFMEVYDLTDTDLKIKDRENFYEKVMEFDKNSIKIMQNYTPCNKKHHYFGLEVFRTVSKMRACKIVSHIMGEPAQEMKCVAVGNYDAGKSCMLLRLNGSPFPHQNTTNYCPSVLDNFFVTCSPWNDKSQNNKVQIRFWDIYDPEGHDRLRPLSYPGTHVLLYCISVVDPCETEYPIELWTKELRYHLPDVPIIMIGTKIDLRNDSKTLQKLSKRGLVPSTKQDGIKIAKKYGFVAYHEISSIEDDWIEDLKQIILVVGGFHGFYHPIGKRKSKSMCKTQ